MKNTDIAKIRQHLKTVRKMVQCPHGSHVDKCDFCKRTRLLDEALALFPCPTCNGQRLIKKYIEPPQPYPRRRDYNWEPCPDCQS